CALSPGVPVPGDRIRPLRTADRLPRRRRLGPQRRRPLGPAIARRALSELLVEPVGPGAAQALPERSAADDLHQPPWQGRVRARRRISVAGRARERHRPVQPRRQARRSAGREVNPERRAIANELYEAGQEYDSRQTNRLSRLRNLRPDAAALLGVLITGARARRILAIGTSNGYSTLWLTDAAQATDGHVESLDIDPRRSEQARDNLVRAGLDDRATCRTASAAQALTEYPDGAWDLIFLDAERAEY